MGIGLAPFLTAFLAFILVAQSIFRSVDVKFQANVQRLSRMNEVFKEEVTFAHRQHIEDHVKEQRISNSAVNQSAGQGERKLIRETERGAQEGSYPSFPTNC